VKILVQYTTQLKAALSRSSDELELPPPVNIAGVISSLREIHGDALLDLLYDERGELLPSVLVSVDDEQVAANDTSELRDGTCITLLSAISGG
jgi:molybdopterin converting factor small subunit